MPTIAAVVSPPLPLLEGGVVCVLRTNTMSLLVPWNMIAVPSQLTAGMKKVQQIGSTFSRVVTEQALLQAAPRHAEQADLAPRLHTEQRPRRAVPTGTHRHTR